jgi:tRNA threonylcarbamoyladenosine biosynthesis protein TsaB
MVREARLLLIETSGRAGWAALGEGESLRGERRLDEARRHARDLAPAVADLLADQGWRPRDLDAVAVGLGPGSYTGLRVGVMSAKALAYAIGRPLIGVETFAAVAHQTPAAAARLDVLADAQQDKVYVQSFTRESGFWQAAGRLTVQPFAAWLAGRAADAWVTGPGLHKWAGRLPAAAPVVDATMWDPQPASVLRLALARLAAGELSDVWTLEPLYLRPSSAEQQWRARQP